jgi:hypothetical protein
MDSNLSPTRSGATQNTNNFATSYKQSELDNYGYVPGQGSQFNPSTVIGPGKGPGKSNLKSPNN